mgnify:CR=1 FL=1
MTRRSVRSVASDSATRSGVPLLKDDPARKGIKGHALPDAALAVPIMCNLGTKEGVTEKGKQFAPDARMEKILSEAVAAVRGGAGILVLSDREVDADHAPSRLRQEGEEGRVAGGEMDHGRPCRGRR